MGDIEAQYEPMPSAIERPVEDRTGVLSRVKEMAVNAWDTVSGHPKEMLAIGAASFACAQVAELGVEAMPAGAAAGKCIPRLERPPVNVQSVMINPSRAEVKTTGVYSAVKGCDSLQREAEHRTQIKDGGHWSGIEGDGWYPVTDKNDRQPFAFLDFSTRGVKENKVNGHWEPAREQFRVVVRDPHTGKVISTGKIRNYKVKVEG